MKKLSIALLALLLSTGLALAGKADLFQLDEAEMETSLAKLESLEQTVKAEKGITYDELKALNSEILVGISDQPILSDATQGDPPLGIPSFLWGCVFGVAGLAIVYFVTEDKDETKKALWGCIASSVVGLILWFAVFGATVASAT
jgi:hypothetical protein